MQPKPNIETLGSTIFNIGQTLSKLDPGALADLRRMSLDGDSPGAPYFWRLAKRHDFPSGPKLHTWARIVQIMAILTDKGSSEGKRSPHSAASEDTGWRGLGHALCDGADPAWGNGESDPRPMLSEQRFARLLAARGAMCAELMERAARALAANKPLGAAVNCVDLAWFLLDPDNPNHARNLARDYYACLDRTGRQDTQSIQVTTTGDAA